MFYSPIFISPSPNFWSKTASVILKSNHLLGQILSAGLCDFSEWQIIVPTFLHKIYWKTAFIQTLKKIAKKQETFILPRINTLSDLLAIHIIEETSNDMDIIKLYTQLRNNNALKKILPVYNTVDFLPLAQILLSLSNELIQVLLSTIQNFPNDVDEYFRIMSSKLPKFINDISSDEVKLVFSTCQNQCNNHNIIVQLFLRMLTLAHTLKNTSLIWINPIKTNNIETIFLQKYSKYAAVQIITLNWNPTLDNTRFFWKIWPEINNTLTSQTTDETNILFLEKLNIELCIADTLEEIAMQSAQIILDWLEHGKTNIAIIVQDYISTRRLCTLLKRAQVLVADEIGEKLINTNVGTTLMSWCEVVTKYGEITTLLDFIKSPFVLTNIANKTIMIMEIELQLRKYNVTHDWHTILTTIKWPLNIAIFLQKIAQQAKIFNGHKNLTTWVKCINQLFEELNMYQALEQDEAGQQVLECLNQININTKINDDEMFSFLEWRKLLQLQLNNTIFIKPITDRRVVMLYLNKARLRNFDAVLFFGIDDQYYPLLQKEKLFFSDIVRHNLGLNTNAIIVQQQLRDFVELLCANKEIVLSWQRYKNGAPNFISSWIKRLQLFLSKFKIAPLNFRKNILPIKYFITSQKNKPAPTAKFLLPVKLSASAYNMLIACPYQFFVLHMLHITIMKEFSKFSEKRDYGSLLHLILMQYHTVIYKKNFSTEQRETILQKISSEIFNQKIIKDPTALSYAIRWKKTIPAYLAWNNAREMQGWHFVYSELFMKRILSWVDGTVQLYGKLDRIDKNEMKEYAILDYKALNLPTLVTKLNNTEDYQLPFYGLLSNGKISQAYYVALEANKNKISDISILNFKKYQTLLEQHIIVTMQAIQQGASMPANGIQSVCQYCKVRGLCRKGYWSY